MKPLAVLAALALVVAACSGTEAESTTTVTTSTTTTVPVRHGLVPDPGAIETAIRDGEITRLQADLSLTSAMWGVFDSIPLEFMAETIADPQWDHTAVSRVVAAWPELDVVTRATLTGAIDGLGWLVGGSNEEEMCIPTSSDGLLVCIGASVSEPAAQLALDTARPWATDAADDAWSAFAALFPSRPTEVRFYLSELHSRGSVAKTDSACLAHVDVYDPGADDGVPPELTVRAATVHQIFHCFQDLQGPPAVALAEGTATWAEHHVYPSLNTELPWLTGFITDPTRPFADRRYDAAYAFLYAGQRHGSSAVIDAVLAGSVSGLVPGETSFADLWHDISVAAWNTDPVRALLDNGEFIPAAVDPGQLVLHPLGPETGGEVAFELAPYSRDLQSLEFLSSGSDADHGNFARVRLDLTGVPSDVHLTALAQTAEGWLDPIDLTGRPEWTLCRAAVGSCSGGHSIHPYSRIVLVVTNVDNGIEQFSIEYETLNPRLDGEWVRTDGPFLTEPGVTAPYAILGTALTFDEAGLSMTEDTGEYTLRAIEPGWQCTFEGVVSAGLEATYEAPRSGGDVDGTIRLGPTNDDDGFTNDCTFEGTAANGLHVPLADEDTLGFEIRGYDTLWIYAAERIYVYERSG